MVASMAVSMAMKRVVQSVAHLAYRKAALMVARKASSSVQRTVGSMAA